MAGWRRTFHGLGSGPGRTGGTGRIARRHRSGLSVALRIAAAGLARPQADPAAAAARATGAGNITIYHSRHIHLSTSPESFNGITGGPRGALWFTNPGNNTIGKITTLGKVRDYAGKGIGKPGSSPRALTGHCGSATGTRARSAGSPPPARSPPSPAPPSPRTASLPAAGTCGTPTGPPRRRSGGSRPGEPRPHSRPREWCIPKSITHGPTGQCGSPTAAFPVPTTRSAGSPIRGPSPFTRSRVSRRDSGRLGRGPVVHLPQQQRRRADHHQRRPH